MSIAWWYSLYWRGVTLHPGYTLCLVLTEFVRELIFSFLNLDLALLLCELCVIVKLFYLVFSSYSKSSPPSFTCLRRRSIDLSLAGVLINDYWLLPPLLFLLFIKDDVFKNTGYSFPKSSSFSSPPKPLPKLPFTKFIPLWFGPTGFYLLR